MRRRTGRGHVCHLVVTLDGPVAWRALRGLLDDGPTPTLSRLRLVERGFGHPAAWAEVGSTGPVREHRLADGIAVEDGLTDGWDVAATGEPSRVDLVHRSAHSEVVFTWNHALLDARGGERWALAAAAADPSVQVLSTSRPPEAPVLDRLARARRARDALFSVSLAPIAALPVRARPAREAPRYVRRTVPTAVVAAAARGAGAGPLRAAVLQAAFARAVQSLLVWRGVAGPDLLVPMPLDRARRGGTPAIAGSHIGVVPVRLAPAELDTLPSAVAAVVDRIKRWTGDELPAAYAALLDLCRLVHPDVLAGLVMLPSAGRWASFGFSHVASRLPELDEIAGRRVVGSRHVPSNLVPPGLTAVAIEAAEQTELIVGYLPSRLDRSEAWSLLTAVEADLAEHA